MKSEKIIILKEKRVKLQWEARLTPEKIAPNKLNLAVTFLDDLQ